MHVIAQHKAFVTVCDVNKTGLSTLVKSKAIRDIQVQQWDSEYHTGPHIAWLLGQTIKMMMT